MQATEDDDGPALHYLAAECANAFNEIMRISRSQKPVVQTEVVGKNFRETRERYEQWSNNYGAAKLPQDEAALTNLIEDLFLIKDTLCRILRDLRETLDLGKSVYGQIWVKQVIIALLVTKIISGDRENKELARSNDDFTDLEIELKALSGESGFTELSPVHSNSTEGPLFELDELLRSASHSVDGLFKTSKLIVMEIESSDRRLAYNEPTNTLPEEKFKSSHAGGEKNRRAFDSKDNVLETRNTSDFRDLRNTLYKSLVAYRCVPKVEIDGVITDQLERSFFPAGTAAKVLTFNKLERLFKLLTPAERVPLSAHLAQQVETRKLHEFLAILVVIRCDIEPLNSFTEKLVASKTWTAAEHALARLPAEHCDNLKTILGDDLTADIFFQKQHDFFAPIIEKNKEIKSQFRRMPYVREKLIGQGSFGKIYEVVVRFAVIQLSHSGIDGQA
jgi:hypothetical protein